MLSQKSELQSLKSEWRQFETTMALEKSQRTKDIESLLGNIDKKIETNAAFMETKNKIAIQNCNLIKSNLEEARGIISKASQREKQNLEAHKAKFDSNFSSIKSSMDKVGDGIGRQTDLKVSELKDKFLKQVDQKNREEDQRKKHISDAKNFIQNQLRKCQKGQNQAIGSLCKKLEEQIAGAQDFLAIKKAQKKEKQMKIKYMIETLLEELERMIDREQKFGKLTYESLLKLIEDFHIFIQGKNIRT